MTHLYVWHDTFICVPWLVRTRELHTHPRRVYIYLCIFIDVYIYTGRCMLIYTYIDIWFIHISIHMDVYLYIYIDKYINWNTYTHVHKHDMCVAWRIHMCAMTYSYPQAAHTPESSVWHDAFICVISLLHMCGMTRQYVCCMHTPMTHWYMWHDAFICAISLIHICGTTHSYACCIHTHDSLICVAWRIHMCDITCHDSFMSRPNVTPSREKRHRTSQWVMSSGITLMKRDLHWSKETHIHEKRPW